MAMPHDTDAMKKQNLPNKLPPDFTKPKNPILTNITTKKPDYQKSGFL